MHAPADLHQARLASGLDLDQLRAITAIKPAAIRAIDEGRFEDLPGGIYARAYVRSFANAVGLDPTTALHAIEHRLPHAADPLPLMRELSERQGKRRLHLNRWIAPVADALLLFGIDAAIVGILSLGSGIALETLVAAGGPVAAPCAVPVAAYLLLFGAVAGRTPGEWLCNCPARRAVRIRVR